MSGSKSIIYHTHYEIKDLHIQSNIFMFIFQLLKGCPCLYSTIENKIRLITAITNTAQILKIMSKYVSRVPAGYAGRRLSVKHEQNYVCE